MIPPSFLPPDDSTCWQWWDPPANGVVSPGVSPPKGCNYKPCQDAVCACDMYCCDTAWDLSCRGYHLNPSDIVDNNYFVDGCSAKMLCCEPESAYPDPPVGGAENQVFQEYIPPPLPPQLPPPQVTEMNEVGINVNVNMEQQEQDPTIFYVGKKGFADYGGKKATKK